MKALLATCLSLASLYADTITSYAMPPLITLAPNANKQDSTLAQKANGEQTFFHARAFSIQGASNATYTLSANDKTTHFQSAGISLKQAKVALMGYHTLAFAEGSVLEVDSSSKLLCDPK